MQIDPGKKVDVLLMALKERYESMHSIRGRVQDVGIWTLGLMFAAGGWLIASPDVIQPDQKYIYAAAIGIAFVILRFWFLRDLQNGFESQQRAAAHIEKTLKLFEPGYYGGTESIYPVAWEHAGTKHGRGHFFRTTYLLIYAGIIFLLLVLFGRDFSL
jgi:hypothetical protein